MSDAGAQPHRGTRALKPAGIISTLAGIATAIPASRGAGMTYIILAIIFFCLGTLLFVVAYLRKPEPMRPVDRRYLREFFTAMGAYVVIMLLVPPVMSHVHGTVARSALALLPIIPTIFVARAIIRRILGGDELERRVLLEATAIAGLIVALVSFSLGMLEAAGVIQLDGALIYVLPAMVAIWGVVLPWLKHRYEGE